MKFTKLTKKLLLSALSLGLAVVTLTTTTFAWYTTSTEARAEGQGSTSGTTDDYSLMISKDGLSWGQKATLDNGVDLVPLQWDATDKRFENLDGADMTVEGGFYEFTLYFKTSGASADKDVYLTNILIWNNERTAVNLKGYENLSSKADGCPTSSTYAVDVVKALDLVIKRGTNAKAYDLTGKFASVAEDYKYLEDQGEWSGTANAIKYYNDVMTNDLTTSETASFETALDYKESLGQIPVGDKLAVTFYIYLNGWDTYCFDACRGQSFNVSLEFSTNQPS